MGNAIRVSCLAFSVASIEQSDGWILGLAENEAANLEDAAKEAWAYLHANKDKKISRASSLASEREAESVYLNRLMAALPLRDVPSEAVDRFFSLPQDEQSVCGFLKRHGVFREQDISLVIQGGVPREIRQRLTEMAKKSKALPFAIRHEDFLQEQVLFKAVISMCTLLRHKEVARANKIATELGLATVGIALRHLFEVGMDAHVGLEFGRGGPFPAILTKFVLASLYAHVWNGIFGVSTLGGLREARSVIRGQQTR